jgi:hypothetical protein
MNGKFTSEANKTPASGPARSLAVRSIAKPISIAGSRKNYHAGIENPAAVINIPPYSNTAVTTGLR